jgi:hypothetical protein
MRNISTIQLLSFVLVFQVFQFNCKSPTSVTVSGIYGKWNWVETSGGFAYQEYFPPPVVMVVFKENDSCFYYRNDTLYSEMKFTLTREKLDQADTQNIISFMSKQPDSAISDTLSDSIIVKSIPVPIINKNYYEIDNQSLIIGDLGSDGFVSMYTKCK